MLRMLRIPLVRPLFSAPILPITTRRSAAIPLPSLNQNARPRMFTHFSARLTAERPNTSSSSQPETDTIKPDTLSGRLKLLIKSYGWYALGVYIILSAVDFSLAFGLVNLVGAQYASKIAGEAKAFLNSWVSHPPDPGSEEKDSISTHQDGHEGIYAMIVVAYTIHKTLFLPLRVGLTAALTPRIVTWLRSRGWTGGAGAKRAVDEIRDRMRNPR